MTDHYLAYLQAETRAARMQIGHLQGRLDAAHADRDAARDEAQTMTLIVNAVLTAHQGCDAETCSTMWAIKAVTRMSALYGCVVCGTPRPAEMDWDWIVQHRALGCAGARWGMLEERP